MPPSIAELRVRTQPDSIFARNSGEHWAGKLYMRRLSPYMTRLLIGTRLRVPATAAVKATSVMVSRDVGSAR